MPPTIQSGRNDQRGRKPRTGERRSEIVVRMKYCNTLPDIPFDPKFVTYPFEANRFVQYNPTSLERTYKHELLTEHDLGVSIDLINPDTYRLTPSSMLAEQDERILEEDSTPQDQKRSRHHNKSVSWLRKTEYISTEYNRFTQSAEKAEARIGFSIKKRLKEEDIYKDRESQIAAINSTFEANKKPLTKHYSKPGVTAVDVLSVFPDFDMWKHPCAQVIFDSDPAEEGKPLSQQQGQMSQAMIRGMVDESGDQFVAYFLPSEETMGKRKRDAEEGIPYSADDTYEYSLAREYNWNVKNKASKGYEENYFMVFKENGVFYNELETRVRLSKRRKVVGASSMANTKLVVKHRELNEQELAAQDLRMTMLEPPVEEEEELEQPNFSDVGSGAESGGEQENTEGRERSKSPKSGSESESEASGKAGSGSEKGSDRESGSESEAESGDEDEKKRDEQEIFGSESSSDSD